MSAVRKQEDWHEGFLLAILFISWCYNASLKYPKGMPCVLAWLDVRFICSVSRVHCVLVYSTKQARVFLASMICEILFENNYLCLLLLFFFFYLKKSNRSCMNCLCSIIHVRGKKLGSMEKSNKKSFLSYLIAQLSLQAYCGKLFWR